MSEERTKMVMELKKWVVPQLKCMGFKGVFPHYRRITEDKVDLLMFQFEKWGGGFFIEISFVLKEGKDRNLIFDDNTQFEKLTVAYTNVRLRLHPKRYNGWFYYYDIAEIVEGGVKLLMPIKPTEKQRFADSANSKVKWVQIVDESIYESLAKEALSYLAEAESWWSKTPCRNEKQGFSKFLKTFFIK